MEHFLRDIEISNFKSIRHQKIEGCKRINLFLGYPNVGKSNILEAIGSVGMFNLSKKKSREIKLADWIRYRGLSTLFYKGKQGSKAEIKMQNEVVYSFYLGENAGGQYVAFSERLGKDLWNYIFFDEKGLGERGSQNKEGNPTPSETKAEEPFYNIKPYKGANTDDISQKGSFSLFFPNGQNLVEVISNSDEVRKELKKHLESNGYKLLIDVASGEIKIIQNTDDSLAYFLDYSLIADTLQRLIFYKAAIASNQNAVLLFEEPEAHMFPPYIKSLMWDVVESKTNQFFIATHSPFVLDTLLEEGGEEVMIYLVDFKNGETVVKSISDTELEEIKRYGIDLFFNMEGYLKDAQQDDL